MMQVPMQRNDAGAMSSRLGALTEAAYGRRLDLEHT
jgi:hypothetical protein